MIIGITGTLGAGKTTLVEFLKEKGFTHYSVRDFLKEEIKKRKLPMNRDSMVKVANDLRTKNSPSYIIEKLYEKAVLNSGPSIIESIRTLGEVACLRKKEGFILVAIDADRKIRFERINKRKSETDNITFIQFVEDEEREMTSDDPNKQNISACMKEADITIINNEKLEKFYKSIEERLWKDLQNKNII